MTGDLHCHTKLSDGGGTIEDVIMYAAKIGLDYISITDHETMAGVTRAAVLGKRFGVNVIPGIECSAWDDTRGRTVHLLCYCPHYPERLDALNNKLLATRKTAGTEMISKVIRLFPITPEHIARYISKSTTIYKVHIMQALLDMGYADSLFGQTYDELFGPDGKCKVSVELPAVSTTIEAIKNAGGLLVLAHPAVYNSFDLLEELGSQHILDGVEHHHPRCTPEQKDLIGGIADRFNLLKTGGSDFHGGWGRPPVPIGHCTIEAKQLDTFLQLMKYKKL